MNSSRSVPGGRRLARRSALAVGYLMLAVAFVAAVSSRATGYELSIYTASPTLFWVGFAVAMCVAIVISVTAYDTLDGALALALAVLAMAGVFALPVLRGYYFYGHGDSLVHLGWAKAFVAGILEPTELIYPGSHLFAGLLAAAAGIPLREALMLVALLFKLLFVVSVPLAVYTMYRNRYAVFLGGFSALLLLPVNHISFHEFFHTFSLTGMFTPFVLYLLFAHVTGRHADPSLPSRLTATSLLLPAVSAALVILHPQAAFNVLIIFGSIVAVQVGYRWLHPSHTISQSRGIHGQFVVLFVVFALWVGQFENTYRTLELMFTSIQGVVMGSEQAGGIIQQRATSSTSIGISPVELFVKLFGVSALYVLLSVGVVLRKLGGHRLDPFKNADTAVMYFAYSGVVLVPFIVVHFLGEIDAYLFRHIGFAMVIGTILGTIALCHLSAVGIGDRLGGVGTRSVVGVVAAVVLVLSVLVVFGSPYIVQPNSQVTQPEMEGYGQLYDHQDDDVPITGLGRNGERFVGALLYEGNVTFGLPMNGTVFNNRLPEHYETDRYLAVSEYDRTRELDVYRELRYTRTGLRRLQTTPGIHRVQTNGDLNVYYIDRGDDEVPEE